MAKLLGLVLMLCSCGIFGQYFASRLNSRVEYLQQLQRGLLALSTEIGYSLQPLPQALKNSGRQAKGEIGGFLLAVGEGLESGMGNSAESIWQEEADSLYSRIYLLPEDKSLIDDFALGLGLSDRNDQLKRIELYRSRLLTLQQEASAEFSRMGKVYRLLGWGGGVMLMLFFI